MSLLANYVPIVYDMLLLRVHIETASLSLTSPLPRTKLGLKYGHHVRRGRDSTGHVQRYRRDEEAPSLVLFAQTGQCLEIE